MSNGKVKRNPTEIYAEILELCRQPTAKTQIMHKTYLSHPALLSCLKELQRIELLRLTDDGRKYETTEKGFEYLKKYSGLQGLLK